MFILRETGLPGLVAIQPRILTDLRGSFVKTYHAGFFEALGLSFQPKEEFFSVSRKGVVRGMHFQNPPSAHAKLVYCVFGGILDVVVDLRRSSPAFGRSASLELSAANREMLFIPMGFAHGFLSLQNDTVVVYQTNAVHSPECDAGILWNSFGFDWPTRTPILSERDQAFPGLAAFNTPF